jgi:hypothetical protein
MADSSSDSLSETIEADLGVLAIADVGSGEGTSTLAAGNLKCVIESWLVKFLLSFRTEVILELSGTVFESAEELCDSDLELFAP